VECYIACFWVVNSVTFNINCGREVPVRNAAPVKLMKIARSFAIKINASIVCLSGDY
jgi:hypothetical protein